MPLLGFALSLHFGVFLIVIKPQVGFTVGLFWLIEAWRKGDDWLDGIGCRVGAVAAALWQDLGVLVKRQLVTHVHPGRPWR